MWKPLAWLGLGLTVMLMLALMLSPWPSVWLIRAVFDRGAADASQALEKHLPATIRSRHGIVYDPADTDALLDIHRPAQLPALAPTVVWVHGGGFVSGRRADINHYLMVLAGHGFATVSVDYSLAPTARYPTPVRQLTRALAYLDQHAGELGLNRQAFVVAGDSAGAQIAAQTAALISDPDYAGLLGIAAPLAPHQVKGALLFCGVFDLNTIDTDKGGVLGWFVRTVNWSYSGERDWRDRPDFHAMSVTRYVGPTFPPAFISAGNADPLVAQSVALYRVLRDHGVRAEGLFFSADHQPGLPHEYQFNLDQADGQLALTRAVAWLNGLQATDGNDAPSVEQTAPTSSAASVPLSNP